MEEFNGDPLTDLSGVSSLMEGYENVITQDVYLNEEKDSKKEVFETFGEELKNNTTDPLDFKDLLNEQENIPPLPDIEKIVPPEIPKILTEKRKNDTEENGIDVQGIINLFESQKQNIDKSENEIPFKKPRTCKLKIKDNMTQNFEPSKADYYFRYRDQISQQQRIQDYVSIRLNKNPILADLKRKQLYYTKFISDAPLSDDIKKKMALDTWKYHFNPDDRHPTGDETAITYNRDGPTEVIDIEMRDGNKNENQTSK